MALLREIAERLSNDVLLQGVIEEIITEDDLFALLDFAQVDGKSLHYNRELTLPTADFLAPNDTVNESAGKVEEVVSLLRAIIGDVDVDSFLNETMSDTNNQAAIQTAMKIKTVGRKFRDALINGNALTCAVNTLTGNPTGFITSVKDISDANQKGTGTIALDVSANTLIYTAPGDAAGTAVTYSADGDYTLYSAQPSKYITVTLDTSEEGVSNATISVPIVESKEFTGLKRLVVPNQIITAGANGAALAWSDLDALTDLVKAGPVSFYLMNERTIRSYRALLRAAGGVDSAMLQLPNFGNGKPVLTLNGAPVLKNNYISVTETQGNSSTCTSVYAVHMGPSGLQGLYGGANAGMRVEDVGIVQNKDARRTRVKWYCGAALYSTLSVARLKGVNN